MKLFQLATSVMLIGASLGIIFGISCSKHHDNPILPAPTPPEPEPIECPLPDPCEITSTIVVEVLQDRSVPNRYRVLFNGRAIIDTVFTDPADNRVVQLRANYIFSQGDEFEFIAEGSRAAFVRVRL